MCLCLCAQMKCRVILPLDLYPKLSQLLLWQTPRTRHSLKATVAQTRAQPHPQTTQEPTPKLTGCPPSCVYIYSHFTQSSMLAETQEVCCYLTLLQHLTPQLIESQLHSQNSHAQGEKPGPRAMVLSLSQSPKVMCKLTQTAGSFHSGAEILVLTWTRAVSDMIGWSR